MSPEFFHKSSGYRIDAHLLFGHEIKHDARIDLPQRVPMESTSGAVNPIVVATARPSWTAHRGAIARDGR
jgi:hypothetical protein